MGKIVNRQELAEMFGYSLPTISAWTADGMPVETAGSRGKQFEYDTEKCLKWLLTREREERKRNTAAQAGEDGEPINIDQARLRHEIAKAKTAEIELAQRMGLVAPKDIIAKVLSNEIANARARLLAIPTKSRPTVHMHVGDPERTKKVVAEIERLVREALDEIKVSAEEAAPQVTDEENG
jgi:terminase small subunit / prophage DNA-packing protein